MGCLVGSCWPRYCVGSKGAETFPNKVMWLYRRADWIPNDEARPLRVVIVTDIPSPYQVELFNAITDLNIWDLTVIYIRRSATERMWESIPISHHHCFLPDTVSSEVHTKIAACDLAIFSGYRPIEVSHLITLRNRTQKAWA